MENLIEKSKTHFRAVIEKRIDEIINFYAETPDLLVFVEGPRWATLGFANVSKGWQDFVGSPIAVKSCEWAENLQSKIIGEMGFVAGIVEMKVEISGAPLRTIRFRGTFVMQLEPDGEWRIIHEHFSQPAENPYGIGDWLKK